MTDARPALFAHRLGFTEQPVGLRWRSGRRTVTEFDLMNFVTTCGFSESLFMDAEAAAEIGFTGRLIPGALTGAGSVSMFVVGGMVATVLRLSGITGPGRRMLVNRALLGEGVSGDWSNRIHIDDAAAAAANWDGSGGGSAGEG